MKLTCKVSGLEYYVSESDQEFIKSISPVVNGNRFGFKNPELCPAERQRLRLLFRNERHLYKNTCAISGSDIISCYSPDKNLKICSRKSFTEVDNLKFGKDFDFNKTFFEQYYDLTRETYKTALVQEGENLNSDYAHFCGWLKNCYLVMDSGKSEDCYYCVFAIFSKNCVDCSYALSSELCYESIKIDNCYQLMYSINCKNCNFSAFLNNCIACSNCIACFNLRNKSYCIFNKEVSKQAYQDFWKSLFVGDRARIEEFKIEYAKFVSELPHRALNNISVVDSTGDYLINCENVNDSFNCTSIKNSRYLYDCHHLQDSQDIAAFGEDLDHCYQLSASGGYVGKISISECAFSNYIFYGGYQVLYSQHCYNNSKNLFGCSDLIGKQFCILNKQYSEKDYWIKLEQIILHMQETGEWGQYFPASHSYFNYNESLAQEDFPLTKEQAVAAGFSWGNDAPSSTNSSIENPSLLPSDFSNLPKTGFVCRETNRSYKIIRQEYDFYKTHGIPLPEYCFSVRAQKRKNSLNPRSLSVRICPITGKEFLTSIPENSNLIVYSEEAYQKYYL